MRTNIMLPIKNYLIRCGLPMLRTLCDELRPTRHRIHIGLSVLVGALILLYIVAVNGYVTFFPDSEGYLKMGMEKTIFHPVRATPYGWFAVYSALKMTLFLTALWQALLTSLCIFYLLWYCAPRIQNRARKVRLTIIFFFLAIVICAFSTGVSVFVSQMMADIFAALALLIVIIFCFHKTQLALRDKIFCAALFSFSVSTHNSYLPAFLLLVALLFLIHIIRHRFRVRDIIYARMTKCLLKITLLILFPVVLLVSLRFVRHHDYYFGSGGETFLVARLLETNIVHDFLHKNCAHYPYKLCPYQDSLQHSSGWFLWGTDSPLDSLGSFDGYKKDAKKMLHDIFSESQYVWAFIKEIPAWTWGQATTYTLGDNISVYPPTQEVIRNYFSLDTSAFYHSKSESETLHVSWLSHIQEISVPIALLSFIILWITARTKAKKSPPPPHTFFGFS